MKILSICLLLFVSTFNINAQLILPAVFNNNMVLQRDSKIPVWGFTKPAEKVMVEFMG